MNILILHRVPYQRIDYARGIDHNLHKVTYFGVRDILNSLPTDLPCVKVERSGTASAFEEARACFGAGPLQFDRIIALSEYELLDAARLREWFGVPGTTVAEVSLVRDKILMKRAVAQAGLRVPRFMPLQALLVNPQRVPWKGITVLKPNSGASSEDVRIFDSPTQVSSAIIAGSSQVARLDKGLAVVSQYEIEEFVGGDILHFDGLMANGELLTIAASRYVGTCLGYAQGQPLGSFHFPITPLYREWAKQALAAVGIRQGCFHLEAIEHNGLVFLEVGNRVGGADVVPTFELATGVHLPSEELRILLDGRPSHRLPSTQVSNAWHGWFVFPGHTHGGEPYGGIAGASRYRHDTSVIRWVELELGTSQAQKVTYSANEAPLAGIVAHRDWQATRDWIERLFHSAQNADALVPQQAAI